MEEYQQVAYAFQQLIGPPNVTLLPAFFVRNPGWWPMFDFDLEMAVQARMQGL